MISTSFGRVSTIQPAKRDRWRYTIYTVTDTKMQSWELILIFTNKEYRGIISTRGFVRRNYACHLHAVDVNVNFLERDCSNMSIEGVARSGASLWTHIFLVSKGGKGGEGRGWAREFSRGTSLRNVKGWRFIIVLLYIDREWNTIFKIDVYSAFSLGLIWDFALIIWNLNVLGGTLA